MPTSVPDGIPLRDGLHQAQTAAGSQPVHIGSGRGLQRGKTAQRLDRIVGHPISLDDNVLHNRIQIPMAASTLSNSAGTWVGSGLTSTALDGSFRP